MSHPDYRAALEASFPFGLDDEGLIKHTWGVKASRSFTQSGPTLYSNILHTCTGSEDATSRAERSRH